MSVPIPSPASLKRTIHFSPAKFAVASLLCFAMLVTGPISMYGATYTWDAGSTTDLLWNTTTNWSSDLLPTSADDLLFPATLPNPAALSNPGTITLGTGEVANSLYFKNNYVLTGGDLTLTSGAVQVDSGSYDTIGSVMHGTSGFVKSGNGSVFLTGANDFTGQTTIEQGTVVISNALALGSSTSPILINGFSGRGLQGGQLVVTGTITSGTIQGITFARSISLSGRGPSQEGAALTSIGNNTFSGNIFTANLAENRIASAFGTATFSGNINSNPSSSTTNFFVLTGNGNFRFTGNLGGGNNTNSSSIVKTGNGGLDLTGLLGSNNFGRLQIDAGTVRVSAGSQIGPSTRTDALIMNAGLLEIRSDAGAGFSSINVNAAQNSTILIDRALAGTSSLNQTVTFPAVSVNNNLTLTVNSRNGENLMLTSLSQNGAANGSGFSWGGNGVATITTLTGTSTTAGQTINLTATGEILNPAAGSYGLPSGNTSIYAKIGGGMFTALGTPTGTVTTAYRIADGTLSIATSANLTSTGVNIGNTTTTAGVLNYLGAGGGAAYGGTGAGEANFSKPVIIGTTTGNASLFANQTGSAPTAVTFSAVSNGFAGAKTFYLGGANALDNTISNPLADNTGALTVGKTGTGTWVLSGNNTYSGATLISGGTLKYTNASTTTLAGALTFTADTSSSTGLTGYQTAGGTFQYNASGGALVFTGGLTPTAGAGNVTINAGTSVTFTPTLGTRGSGATINFTPGSGAIKFSAAVNGTNGIIGGFATINGTDFVASVGAGGSVAAPSYAPSGAVFDSTVNVAAGSVTKNYLSSVTQATPGIFAANSLKVNSGSTLTLGGNLTITAASATSMGGILFDNTGGAGGITGNGITTSAASQELLFYTGGSTPANAFNVASNILNNTATAVTKSGSGTLVLSGAANAFTGNLTINEGTLRASGSNTKILGDITAVGNTTTIRQGTAANPGTLDINGAGASTVLYGSVVSQPLVTIGVLNGGGSTSPSIAASTTANGSTSSSTSLTLTSVTGVALGQVLTGAGVSGNPVVTGISGNVITLSSQQTIANAASLSFVNYATTGATITNTGSASAISIGSSTSTNAANGVFTGVIKDGTGVTTVVRNGVSGTQTLTGRNTYTGPTILSGGATLAVQTLANGGVASGIGASTNAASNLVFNGGTLSYVGGSTTVYQNTQTPSVSIDRLFTLAGNGTINSDGTFGQDDLVANGANSASLVFNNTGAVSYTNTTAAARTLTLGGGSIGDNEIDLQLVNNGSTTNSLGLTKAGVGLWILGNTTNSYTGLTTISNGQLRATDGSTLPTLSPVFFNGTAGTAGVLESTGTFNRTVLSTVPTATSAAGGIAWGNTGGGFAASTAKLIVNLVGPNGTNPLKWAGTGVDAGFVINGQSLIFGSTTSLAETEFQNKIDLNGGSRTITVNDNTNTALDFTTLSGVISNSTGTGNLIINANAPTYLIGANTYTGTTTFNSGNTFVTSLGNSLVGGATSVGTASAASTAGLLFGNSGTSGQMTYVGAGETSDRAWGTIATTGGLTLDSSGSGPLVLTGTFSNVNASAGAKTLTLQGLNADFNTITSNLTNLTGGGAGVFSVTKTGSGIWVLSGNNTYTGTITLSGGYLGVGSDNALGAGTFGAISWSNGGLMAVGADRTISNVTTLNNNNTWNTIGDYSLKFSSLMTWAGSANGNSFVNNVVKGKTVTFDAGFLLNNSGTTSITFTLEGSGDTIINGAVTQAAGANGVNNNFAYTGRVGSTLTFGGSGTNTYSQNLVHNSGTIYINRSGAFNSNNYTFNAGYLENISGSAQIITPATLSAGLNSGSAGIFNLNGTNLFLQGTGSMEFAGQFNNGGANNRTIYNNLSGGAVLTLSGAVNLSSDSSNRTLTIGGGSGQINITGQISPSSAANFTNYSGTLIKNSTGDMNISQPATTVSTNQPYAGSTASAAGQAGLVINGGSVTFNSASTVPFTLQRIDVFSGASLNLDNSTNNVSGRLGTGSFRSVGLNGGSINFTANTAAGTAETIGTLYLGSATNLGGGSTLNFINGGSSASSLSFGGLFQNNFTTLNVVSSSLGTTNKVFLPGLLSNGIFGINSRVMVNGSEYATNSANGLVAYNGYVTSNNLNNSGVLSSQPQFDNYDISSATPTFTGATITGQNKTLNGLKLSSSGATVGANMFTLTASGGAILATNTATAINAPVLAFGSTEGVVTVTSGNDLNISSAITGSAGLTKAGTGSLTLAGAQYNSGVLALNAGTLKVSSPWAVIPTITTPTASALIINGGTLDLNGSSQIFGTLVGNSLVTGNSGTITNTSATSVNLITNSGSAQTFSGVITNGAGALSFYKSGNGGALNLTNVNTYTGSTNVYGNFLVLRDAGAIANTSAVNVNYGTLQFDNTGNQDISTRINTSAPVTLNGGSITLTGAATKLSQQAMGALTAASGQSIITSTITSSGGAFLSFSSFSRNNGATVNFVGSSLGSLYNNTQSGRIVLTGQADGFMGGWATVGGTEFANYITAVDTSTTPKMSQGVAALQSYVDTVDTTWTSADNVKLVNSTGSNPAVYTLGGSRTINSLNIQSTTNPITVNNTALTLVSGGLLSNGTANNTLAGGTLTAGTTSSASELFIMDNSNTTITSQITNNGAGGVVSVVKGLGGTTTFSPTVSSTYGGTTTVNTGTLTIGSLAGVIAIPQALITTSGNVTFSLAQQIASGKNVTMNGNGTITFTNTSNGGTVINTLGALSFNNNGSVGSGTITGGTIITTGITAVSDNIAGTPTIASAVELNGSNLTITTSGLSANALNITGTVQNSSGTAGLIKEGAGSLALTVANTFNGGVTLNNGTLIINNVTSLGTGALSMAAGTTLMSGTASVTPLNTININGNVFLGGSASSNNINLGGTVALGGTARTITVASPSATATLSGLLTGSAALNKAGLGTLALTGGTINYTSGINVNAGVLALDQTLSSFSGPIVVASGATVNLNPGANGSLGVALNPGAFPFAISGAGQVTKTGAFTLSTYGNLTYTGPTTIQAGSLIIAPNAVTNAASTFTASSMVNLGAATTSFGLDNASATGSISVGNSTTAINFLARDTAISTTRTADFASTLTLGTVNRAAGATGFFNFINNVTFQPSADDSVITSNKIIVSGSTGVLDQGVYITSGNMGNPLLRTDFAFRDSAGFVRNIAYGVDAGTYLNAATGLASGGNLKINTNTAESAAIAAGSSANTVLLSGQNANLTLAAGTNSISGILRTAAGANPNGATYLNGQPSFTNNIATVSGGSVDSGFRELLIRSDAANDWLAINSVIAGSGGLTRSGNGGTIIGGSASNTYTGTTTVLGGGTIYLNKTGGATALSGNIISGDASTGHTFQFGLANNSTGLNNQFSTSSVITILENDTLTLNGSSQTLAGIQSPNNSAYIIQNGTATGLYSSTLTINNDTDYSMGAASTMRDSTATGTYQYGNLGFVKGGAGKLTTGIINTSGGITINAGVLALGASTNPGFIAVGTALSAPGTGFLNVASGATLDMPLDFTGDYLTGAGVITNTSASGRTFIIGTFDNTNLSTGAAVPSTWSGVISDGVQGGTIGVQKRGHGTQTFSASQNFTGGLSVGGGTLVLDMSGFTTTNPTNLIRGQNALTLAGTLSIIGKSSGASSQTFNGTTLQAGATELIGNANGGTSLTIDLGSFTRAANNATINFTQATNVSYKTTGLTTVAGYATWTNPGVSLDWAVSTAGTLGAYSAYTVGLPTATGAAATNYLDTTTGVTTTATVALNSLKLAPATTAQTITLGGTLNFTTTATTGPGGILFDGTTAAATITGSSITGSTASTDLVVYTGHVSGAGNNLTIGSTIGTNISTVTKAGPDTLVLSGNNTFGGVLRVAEGTVQFGSVAATATAQPLGQSSTITLGSGNKTGILNYTGATATTFDKAITLAEGGYGQFTISNAAATTLTVGGVISGNGGLILATPTFVPAGGNASGIILSGTNTYLGATTVQSGARLTYNNNAALGASGTLASGTTVLNGGEINITGNVTFGSEILTIAGTGTTGSGAVLVNSGSNDLPTLFKNIILSGNATVGSINGTIRQTGIQNGFINGNGFNLTINNTNFAYLVNEAIDNVPVISTNGGLVIGSMTLNSIVNGVASTGHTLLMTGTGKQIQIRSATVDRAITYTNSSGGSILFGGGDNYVTQQLTLQTGTFALDTNTNAGSAITSLTFKAPVVGVAGTSLTIGGGATKNTGGAPVGPTFVPNVVFSGTGNVFGTMTLRSGTTRIMPIGSAITNPITNTTNVVFQPIDNSGGVASPMFGLYLGLDNSKATGAVSQTFNNLTTTNSTTGGSFAASINLNNTTGQDAALIFGGTLSRAAGSEILVNITGNRTTPSVTNRVDIAGIGSNTISQGIFYGGSDYAFRDTSGTAFLRPINYGTDANSQLVATDTALTANNFTKITGARTAQSSLTIASLAFGNGGNLALAAGQTLTVTSGGLLKSRGGAASVISGGAAIALGNTVTNSGESIVRTDTISDLLTINSAITINGTTKALNKLGMGRLTLGGDSSTTLTAGTINVQEGTLRVTAPIGGLGANAVAVNINNAAALEIDGSNGNVTIGNAFANFGISSIDTSGFMNQSTGSIRNIAGSNTITGLISHPGFSRINSDAGTLSFTTGGFSWAAALNFGGNAAAPTVSSGFVSTPVAAGDIFINAPLTNAAAARTILKDGTGTLTFKPTVAHTNSSVDTFIIRGGKEIWDGGTVATNMFGTNSILTMVGGNLTLKAGAGATAQTIATMTAFDGFNTIATDTTAGGTYTFTMTAMAVPTINGVATGMVNFDTVGSYIWTNGVANNGLAGSAATNGFATLGNDWAVWSAAATPLGGLSSYFALPTTGAVAATNYSISANTALTGTQTGNSLKADTSGGVVTLNLGTFNQTSNALLVSGSNNFTITGTGAFGSTTVTNYVHLQGAGNLVIDAPLADNSGTASVGWLFGGTGTGGVNITSGGSINLTGTANTNPLAFQGGTIANPRAINVNGGAINFGGRGSFDVARNGGDNVVLTLNTGAINIALNNNTTTFNVANNSSSYGKYIQNGGVFTSAAPVLFAYNGTTTNASGAAGTAAFEMHGGTFTVGTSTGSGTYTVFGNNGTFVGAQDGGTINLNRPGSHALFIGAEGTYGAASSYTQSGGLLNVNGNTIIGGRNGGVGSFNISGAGTVVANFYQGVVLGMQDFAQGTITQSGGTVNIGTGQNISDSNYLFGNNTIDLVLGYNQTTQAGRPSITKGTYNLNGGELRVNGITTGQGNQYINSSDSAAGTFTGTATAFAATTTSGGTGTLNWGGGILRPFDSDLTVGNGIIVNLTATGSTVNTDDKAGISRLVTFNTPITGGFGITETGSGTLLFNAVNTYTGDTTITSGTLKPGVASAIPSGTGKGNVILNSGSSLAGTLDLNGFNVSINGLAGNSTSAVLGQVVNNVSGTNVTLTVGNNNQTSTFNGVIKDNTSGTGTIALTKTGTGTLTLGGTNTYTGATIISDGTLAVNGSLAAGSAVSLAAGKTLTGYGTVNGLTTVTSTGIITSTSSGTQSLNLKGGLVLNGTGTINLSNVAGGAASAILNTGALTANGAANSVTLNVAAGTAYTDNAFYTLVNYTGGSILGTGISAFTKGNIAGLTGRQSAGALDFSLANQIRIQIVGDSPKWTGFDTAAQFTQNGGYSTLAPGNGVSSVWKSETLNSWATTNWALQTGGTPTGYTNGDAVLFDDSVLTAGRTFATIAGAIFTAGSPVVTVTDSTGLTAGQEITGPGIPNGAKILTVDSGTQITLTVNTTVGNGSDGTVGDGTTAQSLFAVTGTISGSTTLDISNGNVSPTAVVFNNTTAANYTITSSASQGIAGATSLVKNNTGTVTINTANSFTGGVNLNGGTIVVGNSSALGATSNTLAFGAASNGTLQLKNFSVTIGGLTGDSTAILENGGSTTDSLLTVGGSATSIFGGVLRDGGTNLLGLATSGTATLVLTGADTYTGGTSIGSGSTLRIGNGGTTGSFTGGVTDNGSLVFNRSNSVDFTGTVTGSGTTTVSTGTLVLTGTLGNTGSNTVNSGATLQVGNSTTNGTVGSIIDNGTVNFAVNGTPLAYASTVSGTGNVTVSTGTLVLTGALNNSGTDTINSGATLQIGDGTVNGTFASNVTDNGTLAFMANGSITYANVASGTGSLSVSSGTVILTSGNSYSGGTTVANNSTLQLGTNGTTGSITGDVLVNGTAANLTINRSGTASFNGNITGTGNLNLSGSGTVTLSSTGNTFSGGTNIQRGILRAGATNALSPNSIVTVGSAGQASTLQLFGFNQTVAGIATAGTATSQLITNNATTNDVVLTLNSNNTSTYGGAITNGSTKKTGITLLGGHTLVLTGQATASTYTGITAVQNGTLKIGATNAGNSASSVTLGATGTVGLLDLNGFNGSVGGLATDGAATQASQVVGNSVSTANTLTITPPAATTNVFGGVIADNFGSGSGTTAVTLNGGNATTSIQTLTGTSTYTGATTVTTGVLQIGNAGTTGALGSTAVSIGASGVLQYNRTDSATFGGVTGITGAGAITLTGGGTLNTGTTDGLINTTGALNFGNAAGSTALGNLAVNANTTVGSVLVRTNNASANTITIASGKTLTVNGAGGFDVQSPTTSSTTALTVSGAGTLTVNNASANFLQDAAGVTPVTNNIDFSGLATFNATVASFQVGAGNATASMTGSMTLGTTSTITSSGSFYVGRSNAGAGGSAATLKLGQTNTINSGTAGTTGIFVGTDKANGTLNFNSSLTNPTLTIRGSTGGSSAADLSIGVQNVSTGTAIIGNVLLDAGLGRTGGSIDAVLATLKIGEGSNGASAGTGTGTLQFDQGTVTAANVIIGSAVTGSVAGSTGTGTLNVKGGSLTAGVGGIIIGNKSGGAANATGTLNITGGTVTTTSVGIQTGGAGTGAATSTLNLDGGTLDLNNNAIGASGATITNLTFASGTLKNVSQINNGAAVSKTTAGTLILGGTNTYTGATTVSAGALQVDGTTSSSSAFTVNGGTAVLAGTGTVGGNTTVTLGSIKPGATAGAGVGNLNIGGTLAVGGSGSLSLDLIASAFTDSNFAATYNGIFTALTYLNDLRTANGINDATIASWKYNATASNNDFINVTGTLSLNSSSTLQLNDASAGSLVSGLQIGSVFNLMDWSGVRTGSAGSSTLILPSTFSNALTAANLSFDTSAFSTYGVVVVVPEPSRVLLLLVSILALGLRRRRHAL